MSSAVWSELGVIAGLVGSRAASAGARGLHRLVLVDCIGWCSWTASAGQKQAKKRAKLLPKRTTGATEIQFFGFYSLSEKTNPYRMGTLVRDGQTHVQGIFAR
jgi:hypothetical protein